MNFAAQTQNDKPRWDIVQAELGEGNAAGARLVLVPVHRNDSNEQRSIERV
jgi:hypothetical protein